MCNLLDCLIYCLCGEIFILLLWLDLDVVGWSAVFGHASRRTLGQCHHFAADWNISTTNGWIDMNLCTDVNEDQVMNPADLG